MKRVIKFEISYYYAGGVDDFSAFVFSHSGCVYTQIHTHKII